MYKFSWMGTVDFTNRLSGICWSNEMLAPLPHHFCPLLLCQLSLLDIQNYIAMLQKLRLEAIKQKTNILRIYGTNCWK